MQNILIQIPVEDCYVQAMLDEMEGALGSVAGEYGLDMSQLVLLAVTPDRAVDVALDPEGAGLRIVECGPEGAGGVN